MMKELSQTIEMMLSADYKERFKAEYWQIKIRLEKLDELLLKHSAGKLDFMLSCDVGILVCQRNCMKDYLLCLAKRAAIEGIELEEV